MSISTKIADYILAIKYENIPKDVLEISKFAIADYFAVTYCGSKTKDAKIIKSYADTCNNDDKCSIIGYADKYSAQYAALINGVMSHALDFDDVGLTAINHPTVTIAPVVFALGEELNKGGKAILTAFTLGVEVEHKIAAAIMPSLTNRGWHTTSIIGTIGASIAAALMYDMDKEQIVNTLGIAASLASGVRANFGTYTKPFHAGMAAQNGIIAAQLALNGMTASQMAFEGNDGYALAFTNLTITEDDIKLGAPWDAQYAGFQFKKYPVCSSSHTALDAFIELKKEHGFKYDDIERVIAGMSEFAFRNLLFNDPVTPQQAKFSMPYAIACSAVFGNLTLDSFDDDAIYENRVRELMPRVEMTLDNAFKDEGILSNEPAIVYVTLKNGTKLIKRVDYALGTIKNPLTKEMLKLKFDNCLKDKNTIIRDKMFESIFALEGFKNIIDFIYELPD